MTEIQQPLINKYRPIDFSEVQGHVRQVAALQRAIEADTCPHSFLFTGSAGLGKTSLARIVARHLNADVLEIDAASNNGIDDVRELINGAAYISLQGNGNRAYIIDECHALSRPAWQALLKLLEEPPAHLYIMLCTTEAAKIPETIKTRCFSTVLRPASVIEMREYLDLIADLEEWQVVPEVMQTIVQEAGGSFRKGLSILQAVHDVPSKAEMKRIIAIELEEGDALFDLCGALIKQKSWEIVKPILANIGDDEFANANILIGRYLGAAMLRAESGKEAHRAWIMLDALLFPTASFDPKATFLAAVGRVFFAKD